MSSKAIHEPSYLPPPSKPPQSSSYPNSCCVLLPVVFFFSRYIMARVLFFMLRLSFLILILLLPYRLYRTVNLTRQYQLNNSARQFQSRFLFQICTIICCQWSFQYANLKRDTVLLITLGIFRST